MKRADSWMILAGAAISVAAPVVCVGASFVVETRVVWENGVDGSEYSNAQLPADNSASWNEDGELLFPFIVDGDVDWAHSGAYLYRLSGSESTVEPLSLAEADLSYPQIRVLPFGGVLKLLLTTHEGAYLYDLIDNVLTLDRTLAGNWYGRHQALLAEDGTLHLVGYSTAIEGTGWTHYYYKWNIVPPDGSEQLATWHGTFLFNTLMTSAQSVANIDRTVSTFAGSKFLTGAQSNAAFELVGDEQVVQGGSYNALGTLRRPDGSINGLIKAGSNQNSIFWLFVQESENSWIATERVLGLPHPGVSTLSRYTEFSSPIHSKSIGPEPRETILMQCGGENAEGDSTYQLISITRSPGSASWEANLLRSISCDEDCRISSWISGATSDQGGILDCFLVESSSETSSHLLHVRALNTQGTDWESIPGACLAVFLGHLELLPAGLAPYDKDGNGFVDVADYIARHKTQ